ncbi:TrmB family transcriptional regulator [Halorubrum ruber]|uniref:TrmB family transcriptional regulator n=1 Tax=Halorubrum ruber TaxID=2982524 RepID=A0A8T8LID1_9EURY|nr:TrmB family transcriptional regulator sugar-binding domain-containing protein [Halorubrum ruber]QUO46675.1 TrmB family transcriptional regulator [Halorubrum ruber]
MSGTDPDLRDQLKSFGFSDKEIDTYTTILTLGEAKASAIAEGADVSKRYVYNVLGEFEDRGLVEIHDHETPTTVRALDPSTVVDRLSDTLSTLEGNLDALYEPDPEVDRRYEVIKSTATVRKRISRLLREAENEVSLSVHASIVSDLAADLRSAVDRGVLTLVLVNDDGTDAVERDRFEGLGSAVRVWDHTGPMILSVDRTHGLFSPPEVVVGPPTDQQAIGFTEDRLSPALVGSFLGNYWPLATEVYVDGPSEPPETYDRFRHAVLDATLHRRRDRELIAEVSVRPARSSEPFETRRGRVTTVRQGLVEPTTNNIPIENALVLDDGSEEFTVGGPGAIMETYEARRVTLETPETADQSVSELLDSSSKV